MSGKRMARKRYDTEKQWDWFGTAVIVSIVVHCLIMIFLPRAVSRNTTRLIVRSMAFIRKDVVDPIRSPSVPEAALSSKNDRTRLERVARSEILEVSAAPTETGPDKLATPHQKLKFTDKLSRRPGGKIDNSPRFLEMVRSRISESCERHMSGSVSMIGLQRIVVLSITILPSGKLESVEVVKSSNLPVVDRASVEAVKLAAPFPRFPRGLDLQRLKLRVPIKFVLDRKAG